MGYFDYLFYMQGGGGKTAIWHLTSDSHKTWYIIPWGKNFSNLANN